MSSARHTHGIVIALCAIAAKRLNLSHGADADDTFDREVRLVLEVSCEVVRAELIPRDE